MMKYFSALQIQCEKKEGKQQTKQQNVQKTRYRHAMLNCKIDLENVLRAITKNKFRIYLMMEKLKNQENLIRFCSINKLVYSE